ncbi:MAG: glycosyl transferase, partial [Chloroflexales bacterium]|nr:glycosyl transferase [Chloroflexales bacterium]
WALLLRTLYRQPAFWALLWPLGTLCYGAIAARAAWRVWSGRGVEWKGRTYEG